MHPRRRNWARRINARELGGVGLRAMVNAWLDSGNLAQAEPTLKRALSVFENLEISNLSRPATVLASLGFLYRMEKKPGIAEDAQIRAFDLKRSLSGPTHPQVTPILAMLVDVWSQTGNNEKAETTVWQCVEILVNHFGEQSFPVPLLYARRRGIELRAGNPEAAADRSVVLASVIDRYAALLKRMYRGRTPNYF
jgi:DNA-binding phage protein